MSERGFKFFTCDVFTEHRFGGNPLAVLPDARGLTDAEMQLIAREFNFSETTFVLGPADPRHAARVRIFTPVRELPFAGHPTVGTAFVLATLGVVARDAHDIVFEEGVGAVPVRIERDGERVTRCTLTVAQLPQQGPAAPSRDQLASMLSLETNDVLEGAQSWSCGLPFLVVPVRDIAALGRCVPNEAAVMRALANYPTRALYAAVREGDRWRVRCFVPHQSIVEDPATGSAAAAFGGWLAARAPRGESTLRYRLNQGVEMGRPSELALEIDRAEGSVSAVRVGGASVMVSEGTLKVT
ncbi:MAG TPA: PhzF family phenazine biosynthesis protein [Burkholderiaceae bacterium]|nr:PhzF family phenazine biosynthesis protein [Burkholderiaceae bacterium]